MFCTTCSEGRGSIVQNVAPGQLQVLFGTIKKRRLAAPASGGARVSRATRPCARSPTAMALTFDECEGLPSRTFFEKIVSLTSAPAPSHRVTLRGDPSLNGSHARFEKYRAVPKVRELEY